MKLVLVFLCTVLAIGCSSQSKSGDFRFVVQFAEGAGLKRGDKVKCLGVPVGEVESITVSQSKASTPPVANVGVMLNDSTIHIRKNDLFRVATNGLLGDAYLQIDPGKEDSPPLSEGATVRGESGPSLRDLEANFQPMAKIASKLASLPSGKREEMLTKFLKLLDEASKEPANSPAEKNNARKR